MININQLSQLRNIQNVSQETLKPNNTDGEDFLALLKKIQSKNTSISNQSDSQYSKLSNNILSPSLTSSVSGTQAFLSNMQSVKSTNPIYNAIDTVNMAQLKADKSTSAFAAGYGDELQVVLDVSKAEKYLQFFSEVRVKFVNAIKELTRTQI